MRATSVFAIALIVAFPLALAHTPARAADSWCRLADPGDTERLRRQRKIPNDEISKVPCPPRADPASFPDELVLPMPCGQAMVFRKVSVPLKSLLDQKEIWLGDADPGAGENDPTGASMHKALSGPWKASISGSLAPPGAGNARFYYIGKYEVSAHQFGLFRAGLLEPGAEQRPAACAPVEQASKGIVGTQVLPAVDMTWFDAAAFADALTRYLVALDQARIVQHRPPAALPWVEATPAYLRLPTETEWEYAARGGEATPATQQQRVYTIRGDDGALTVPQVEDVAAVNTADDPPPDGQSVRYMGRKKPNLLGLYDVLGNVDEMTGDLFRPVGPAGERIALSGGVVLRGGNATSPLEVIGVGMRRELSLYRIDGPAHSSVTGFRLVMAGPFLVNKRDARYAEMVGNPELYAEINAEFVNRVVPTGGGAEQRQQVNKEIAALKGAIEKREFDVAALGQRLLLLQAEVDRANAAVNERDRRNREQLVENQIGLAVGYNALFIRVALAPTVLGPLRELVRGTPESSPEHRSAATALTEREGDVTRLESTRREAFHLYVDGLAEILRDGGAAAAEAIAAVEVASRNRSDRDYQRAFRAVRAHLQQLERSGASAKQTDMDRWRADLEQGFKNQ